MSTKRGFDGTKAQLFGFWFDIQTDADGKEFVYVTEADSKFINNYCVQTSKSVVGIHYI